MVLLEHEIMNGMAVYDCIEELGATTTFTLDGCFGIMTTAIACQEPSAQSLCPGERVPDLLRHMIRPRLVEPQIVFVASLLVLFVEGGDSATAELLGELQPA